MPHDVLRHGTLPSIDAGEKRLRPQPKDLPKLLAHNAQDFFVSKLQDLLVAAAAKKTADQRPICRSTMRKFVVYKSRRQHALAFTAWHQEAEARRQSGSYFFVKTQRNRY